MNTDDPILATVLACRARLDQLVLDATRLRDNMAESLWGLQRGGRTDQPYTGPERRKTVQHTTGE